MACCRGMLLGDDSLDRLKLGIARLLLDHRADPSLETNTDAQPSSG